MFTPCEVGLGLCKEVPNRVVRPENPWALDPKVRGRQIEDYLTRTEYAQWQRADDFINPNTGQPFRSNNFPLIDFQKGNNVASLKTVDTTGTSWLGRMQAHIDDLATRGITVSGKPANAILDLRVQLGGANAASDLIQYGRSSGITVIVKEF